MCNGVNAAKGGYQLPPLPVPTLSRVIQGATLDEAERAELIQWYTAVNKGAADLAAESSAFRLVKKRVK